MKSLRIVPIALVVILIAVTNWAAPPTFAASYIVDTTADDPGTTLTACTGAAADCSLRGAISNANAAASPGDVITFNAGVFPTGTPASIVLTAGITMTAAGGGGDTIDGTGAGVILDGGPDIQIIDCLGVLSAANVIANLQVTDCVNGIHLSGVVSDNNVVGPGNMVFGNVNGISLPGGNATGNVIKGNFIGTTADGTAVNGSGGNGTGIQINSPSNTIGGVTVADRNIISGNNTGVRIQDNVINNDVFGNYIGTDVTGTVDLGNVTGLTLQSAGFTDVGGALAGQPNLISGNGGGGNVLLVTGSYNNRIVNNIIGPDIASSGATMTNSDAGISIVGGSDDNEVTGNLISDNLHGIVILNSTTDGNVVKGNFIGTGPGGSGSVPNSNLGIYVANDAHNNTIGGVLAGEGNVIANNGSAGVIVEDPGATGNSVRGNSIHDNAGSEILLLDGGNGELAAPAITMAGAGAAGGTACANCSIDVFSDGVADAEVYEGSTDADGAGNWAFYGERALGFWTATATDASGNTSGLSAALASTADFDNDGVPDSLDNCLGTANGPGQAALLGVGNQADADGDGINGAEGATGTTWGGDACDVDDDDDGVPDTMDICRTQAEDYDGYQDGDTCPDADNDSDGICDDGLLSVSCIGSDTGKSCFDPAGTLPCHLAVASDCRNVAEDQDGFKDGDGCPEPDNDNDGFPDYADNCPGTGQLAGPDGMLGAPQDLNHNGVRNDPPELAFSTDDLQVTFEDYDTVLDGDGCHDSPGDDFDGDGFTDDAEVFTHLTLPYNPDTDADTVVDGTDNCPNWPNTAQNLPAWTIPALDSDCDGFNKTREQYMGTDPTKHCNLTSATNDEVVDFWPTDFNDSRLTSLADVVLMGPVYNQSTGSDPAKKRFDLNASGVVSLADVVLMGPFYNKGCG